MFFHKKKETTLLKSEINALRERLSIATAYLEKIAEGKFETALNDFTVKHEDAGSSSFLDTLKRVNHKLIDYAQKEAERKWVAAGMSAFMSLLGSDSRTKNDFYDQLLKLLVQYTGANQGGIFLLNDQSHEPFLELTACYAFDKKKHLEKKIAIGQGLLGQCFMDKTTNLYSNVPQFYTQITSGLGEATPSFLVLVPMRYNNVVLGVIEMAYFIKQAPYQIEFIEKIAESIASVTSNIRHSQRAESLFAESQEKAKALLEREEALRQNVEELMATQEEMKRHQAELDSQSLLMKFIVDHVPFPIFVKDERGRYVLVNIAESKLFNLPDKELIGKDDSHFVRNELEWEIIRKSDEKVLDSGEPVELPLQHFTTQGGKSHMFKTTKIPFVNHLTNKKNILGVSIDLTEKLTLENDLATEIRNNDSHQVLNIAGRQRMLAQKVGFYCEALLRGELQNTNVLRDAIELHEHTMLVLRFGGIPMEVTSRKPLEPLAQELIPYMVKIEQVWTMYKNAAENILYFSSSDHMINTDLQEEILQNICVIEENAEKLLTLNNEFIIAYLEHSHSWLHETIDDTPLPFSGAFKDTSH